MTKYSLEVIDTTIKNCFKEILQEQSGTTVDDIEMSAVLLDSGLDSLGFAILVSRLEDELGFDPFSEADEAYYPQTFSDFIDFYFKNQA